MTQVPARFLTLALVFSTAPFVASAQVSTSTPLTAVAPVTANTLVASEASDAASVAIPASSSRAEVAPAADTVPDSGFSSSAAPESSTSTLPDDPSVTLHAYVGAAAQPSTNRHQASKYSLYIDPDETAVPLSAGDKFVLSLRSVATPLSLSSMVIAAGYQQVLNNAPNYGTDRGAFGARIGADALGQTIQSVFTVGVLSPLLHDDPRYYRMGTGNVIHRALYAGTRIFVTRTDSGRSTVNLPQLVGYAGQAAITPAYYPDANHNFRDIASGYGGSLGGAALGYLVFEFLDPVFKALHLEK